VRPPGRLRLPTRFQPLQPVLSDRLQHPEARLAVALLLAHQALVDQRRQPVEDVSFPGRGADGLRGREGAAAGADRQPAEEGPLLSAQQIVAPADGVAQRPLPRRQVAGTTGQYPQPVSQALQEDGGREELDAGGGQLDRERQPVEPPADLGDRRRRLVGDGEVVPGLPGAVDEQPHRLVLREVREG
jgi:hypothetical protein